MSQFNDTSQVRLNPSLEKFHDQARVWVYNSDRFLTEKEQHDLLTDLQAFTREWTAHQQSLTATADLLFRRHLVLGVDVSGAMASGCSIDGSVHFLQELGARYGFDPMDRLHYTYLDSEGEPQMIHHHELPDAVEGGLITANTFFINPLVSTKKELLDKFVLPLGENFHSKFIPGLSS